MEFLFALGGIGLFLVGITVLTEGLTGAVGTVLRHVLAGWTRTPYSGAVFGALTTAVIQSSSATSVAAVGFVGAGLLTFPQALGILFGANIGTTITGWMVAIIGFKLQLGQAVLPLILIGVLLRLFARGRLRHVGWALVGFGLLFVGIDTMKQGLAGLESVLTPTAFPEDTLVGRLQLVLIGVAITLVTQSSSAGVAAALVALGAGTITFPQAAAMVIGMDVGTTFTGVLATVGGSAAARRTGYADVLYNILTGIMAFVVLGPYIAFVEPYLAKHGAGDQQIALVAFHTMFNVLGVAIVLPFAHSFGRLVIRLIPQTAPVLLRRIDQSLLSDADSAVATVVATLDDIARIMATDVARIVRSGGSDRKWLRSGEVSEALHATRQFIDQVPVGKKGETAHARRAAALHVLDHLNRVVHRCEQTERIASLNADRRLRRFSSLLSHELAVLDWGDLAASRARMNRVRQLLRRQRRIYREWCIARASGEDLDAREILLRLDSMRWLHRVSYHFWRIMHHQELARADVVIATGAEEARIDVHED
jgi:phosphate:Na+ symporter